MLKCSRCRHIFPAPPTQRTDEASDPSATGGSANPPHAPVPSDEISLSFEEPEWEELQPELPLSAPEDDFSFGTPAETGTAVSPLSDDGLADDADMEEDSGIYTTAGTEGDADESVDDDDGDESSHHKVVSSFFVFLTLILGLYVVFAITLVGNRALAEKIVSNLPLVGTTLVSTRDVLRKVVLADVEGSFARLKSGQEVFVVKGRAFNTTSKPLRSVEVEVRLLDDKGHDLRRGTAPWGGVVSQRMLGELTLTELEGLWRARPGKDFNVMPGESAPFTVVFVNPPGTATEFVGRVVAARQT